MSASGPPEWGADDTGAVPVGPEPEPTGAAGSGQGPGGWGGKPRVEPFAIAAMVWAVVSIVLPILGTIVALVLSARAADSIRQSRGTRSGMQLVTAARITAAPTAPTSGPTTAPTQPTTAPTQPTTAPNPGEPEERRITNRLLRPTRLGPSNRGVPNSARVVVQYTPGASVTVTWAIDNGEPPLPTGTPTCAAGPPTTSTTTTSSTSTTSATTTTTSTSTTTTTTAPGLSTVEVARQEAVKILKVLKTDIDDRRLDVTGIQLIGRYPIEGAGTADVDVVQVFYYASTIAGGVPGPAKVFVAPPAGEVQCLNPAFT